MNNYGIDIWSDKNFIIKDGEVRLNFKSKPSLLQISKEIRSNGTKGPLLLRFPHLIKNKLKVYIQTLIMLYMKMITKVHLGLYFL